MIWLKTFASRSLIMVKHLHLEVLSWLRKTGYKNGNLSRTPAC